MWGIKKASFLKVKKVMRWGGYELQMLVFYSMIRAWHGKKFNFCCYHMYTIAFM